MDTNTKQQVRTLLPWYHLGKLSDTEKALVDKATLEDSVLRDELALEAEMIKQTRADKTVMDGTALQSAQVRLNSVLAKIDALETPSEQVAAEPAKASAPQAPTLFARIKAYVDNLLTGNSHSFSYAVFAVLTVVQLGLLMFFVLPSANITSEYGLASYTESSPGTQVVSAPTDADNTVLLIGLDENIHFEQIESLFSDVENVQAELLPDDAGFYRVRLNKKLTAEELEGLENELSKKHASIWFVGEQFPN